MPQPIQIAIIGTGNVAFHMASRLKEVGNPPVAIISRSEEKARQFIATLGLDGSTVTEVTKRSLDFVFLATTDRHLPEALARLKLEGESVLLHGSGALEMNILKDHSRSYGVLYPFQTFSKNDIVNFEELPILVEGCNPRVEDDIFDLAKLVSPRVQRITTPQRLQIHLAAVFACNFTNNLYDITSSLLENSGLDLSGMEHLIQQTVKKAMDLTPAKAQTGPAVRGDQNIIKKHLQALEGTKWQELYALHTRLIQDRD